MDAQSIASRAGKNIVSTKDDLHPSPLRILRDLLVDEVLQVLRQSGHERRTWTAIRKGQKRSARWLGSARTRIRRKRTRSNTVAVERRLLGQLLSLPESLLLQVLGLLRGPKSPASLLVHLCSRRNTVDGHEEDLAGLDFGEEVVDVGVDGEDHLLLGQSEGGVALGRRWVGTVVDDTIHVEADQEHKGRGQIMRVLMRVLDNSTDRRDGLEVVEDGYRLRSDELRCQRVTLPEGRSR